MRNSIVTNNQSVTIMSNIKTSLDANTEQLTAVDAQWEMTQKKIEGVDYRLYKSAPANMVELINAGRAHGDKEFLIYEDERITFDEYFRQVDALAHQLQNKYHISKDDRVAIAMRNYPEWMIAFAAVILAGGVVVPLNSWGQAAELEYALTDSGAKVAFFDQQRYDHVANQLSSLNVAGIVAKPQGSLEQAEDFADIIKQAKDKKPAEQTIDAEDMAMIMYTSGTTGNPKGAVSCHRNVCQTIYNFEFGGTCSAMTDLDPVMKMLERGFDSKVLLALPLFHVSGCYSVFLLSLRAGRSIVIMHKWDKIKALKTIEEERVTMLSAVPTMLLEVLEAPEWNDYNTESMFSFGAGGAAQPPHLADEIYAKLPDGFPGTGYGMTESNACGFAATGAVYKYKPNSAGCIAPIVDVRIVDENGKDLPAGERGEVYLKSPTIVKGYWNKPEATSETFVDGWLLTGDVGYLDDEGFLYITDRIKDMVIRGGENIYSVEVEGAILTHKAVEEAAAFGIPHDTLGEELAVALVLKEGATISIAEVQAHIGEQLAKFKIPSHVFFEQEMPKNATQKIMKKPLKEKYAK